MYSFGLVNSYIIVSTFTDIHASLTQPHWRVVVQPVVIILKFLVHISIYVFYISHVYNNI